MSRLRAEEFSTISGLPTEPLYSPANTPLDYERDLGDPGQYPYTRGVSRQHVSRTAVDDAPVRRLRNAEERTSGSSSCSTMARQG